MEGDISETELVDKVCDKVYETDVYKDLAPDLLSFPPGYWKSDYLHTIQDVTCSGERTSLTTCKLVFGSKLWLSLGHSH